MRSVAEDVATKAGLIVHHYCDKCDIQCDVDVLSGEARWFESGQDMDIPF